MPADSCVGPQRKRASVAVSSAPSATILSSAIALLVAAAVSTNCSRAAIATLAHAYNPDTIGIIQPNRYQVTYGQRLTYFFVALAVIAIAGAAFMIAIFFMDRLDKQRAKTIDHERCIRHIQSYEDRRSGEVKPNETVFDYHYFPSSHRPDHVVTSEMASIDDKAISKMRRHALQRRQLENASRSVVQMARSQMRQIAAAAATPKKDESKSGAAGGGGSAFAYGSDGADTTKKGFASNDVTSNGSYIPTTNHLGGLTNSSGDHSPKLSHMDTAPAGAMSSALANRGGGGASTGAGGGGTFYGANDYFGFDDDLDFDLHGIH